MMNRMREDMVVFQLIFRFPAKPSIIWRNPKLHQDLNGLPMYPWRGIKPLVV
ncbi:hypothetical protein RchiOBHm_Chr5g0050301 [Rosa chinensis]|uniref:Uncharacterized protein n=1 Tax=Rosa chinensis TaxID=74649 RepID=A0A2P6QF40_ROSCH|nr:hypothetical protein RchiOBHm_Chr5g0050301 [Rosa chinensis]